MQGAKQPDWVYPRMRGGAGCIPCRLAIGTGLSPHARGSRSAAGVVHIALGSIPACAGEPPGLQGGAQPSRVYPRMRGGARAGDLLRSRLRGLSPHARGSQGRRGVHVGDPGSIPACAGEPVVHALVAPPEGVYPRMRGGARSL